MVPAALAILVLLAGLAHADPAPALESPSVVVLDAEGLTEIDGKPYTVALLGGETANSRFLDFAKVAHWLDSLK